MRQLNKIGPSNSLLESWQQRIVNLDDRVDSTIILDFGCQNYLVSVDELQKMVLVPQISSTLTKYLRCY